MKYSHILLYSIVIFPQFGFAKEQASLFSSGRSLGRGGSFVAARDSYEATRLNTATLAERDLSYQLRLLELDFFIGENSISTINNQ